MHSVHLGPLLGEGGFAFVYACTDAQDPSHRYVLKKILVQNQDNKALVEKEIRLLQTLQHPNIVTFYDAQFQPPLSSASACQLEALLLMEECQGGSLFDLVRGRQTGGKFPFARSEILDIAHDIASAVAVMHHQQPHPIAHRDLKLENVLLTYTHTHTHTQKETYKLIDFGSAVAGPVPLTNAQERAHEEERIIKTTTQMYRAPEMVDLYMRRALDEKVDVWALGCVFFTVLHLVHPFDGAGNLGMLYIYMCVYMYVYIGKRKRIQAQNEISSLYTHKHIHTPPPPHRHSQRQDQKSRRRRSTTHRLPRADRQNVDLRCLCQNHDRRSPGLHCLFTARAASSCTHSFHTGGEETDGEGRG